MTEETTTNSTETKKDLARRWSIVGLGAAVATVIVAMGFSDNDSEDEEVDTDSTGEDETPEAEVITEEA